MKQKPSDTNPIKRVVIATFLYTNYGGLLQGFALKYYLCKFKNLAVYNLDFYTKSHYNDSRVFNLYGGLRSRIGQILFSLIRFRQLTRRNKKTASFKLNNFNLTRRYNTIDDFRNNPPSAEIFLTGSDQVFNPNGLYKDVFYLNFKKQNFKKVAYAASFGGDSFSKEMSNWIKPVVNDFDSLSCREKTGSDFLTKTLGKNVKRVVDPVFLLNDEEWTNVSISAKIKEKYILIYALAAELDLVTIAKKIKKETGYKIICVRYNTRNFLDVDKVYYGCSPFEVVGLFKNASHIITDSFHGTAFSIIFDKAFNVFISRPEVSTRIYSLVDLVSLSKRIITIENINNFVYVDSYKEIDRTKLDEMIIQSKNYLKEEIIE
jgi:hypothetical protein